jgi:hypothetical protein
MIIYYEVLPIIGAFNTTFLRLTLDNSLLVSFLMISINLLLSNTSLFINVSHSTKKKKNFPPKVKKDFSYIYHMTLM